MTAKNNDCDCKERVALELAEKIATIESRGDEIKPEQARDYWFKLYAQARAVVYGRSPE